MQQQQQYVGIDLHRRRSVIVRMTETGEVLSTVQIENDPMALALAIAEAGPDPEVALESTYGWYWAADLLQAEGARVHLVHPLGLHWDTRRVKNDVRDATALANRLRQNDLPESWIAPPAVRELREIVSYRAKLTALRTSAKAQIHAVMAKHGYLPELDDMFGPGGQALLDQMSFEGVYALRVESLRDLLELYNRELTMVERQMRKMFKDHAGYQAIQAITGVGPVMAAIFCAEIGDVSRFPTARHLCSWAGLTPSLPRVRRQIPPRPHHQARVGAGALGGHRGRGPLPRRRPHPPRLQTHRGSARQDDRPRRRGQEASDAGVLRATRRRDPLSGPPGGQLMRFGHSQDASSSIDVAPHTCGRGRGN